MSIPIDGRDSSPSHFTYRQYTPTAITTTNPIRVTIPDHNFLPKQALRATKFVTIPFANATGMEQLNNRIFYVDLVDGDTFALFDVYGVGIDGTNYTPFVYNGLAEFTLTGPDLFVENPAPPPPPGVPDPFI